MKKIILSIIFLVLMVNLVSAGLLPYALNGRVKYSDDVIEGVKVKIETKPNAFLTNYDKKVEVTTNSEGEFAYNLGNLPFDKFYDGMVIKVQVCNINPECIQIKTIGNECNSEGGCEFYFDIAAGATVIKDGEVVIIEESVVKYVCSDGTKVDDASQCPEDTEDYFNYIIGAVIALGGIGFAALIRYWWKKDKARAVKMAKTYVSKRKK